jgi:hypothetical protein
MTNDAWYGYLHVIRPRPPTVGCITQVILPRGFTRVDRIETTG